MTSLNHYIPESKVFMLVKIIHRSTGVAKPNTHIFHPVPGIPTIPTQDHKTRR
jgi:hypothetical protein